MDCGPSNYAHNRNKNCPRFWAKFTIRFCYIVSPPLKNLAFETWLRGVGGEKKTPRFFKICFLVASSHDRYMLNLSYSKLWWGWRPAGIDAIPCFWPVIGITSRSKHPIVQPVLDDRGSVHSAPFIRLRFISSRWDLACQASCTTQRHETSLIAALNLSFPPIQWTVEGAFLAQKISLTKPKFIELGLI